MCCFTILPWRDFSKAKIGEQGKVQEREGGRELLGNLRSRARLRDKGKDGKAMSEVRVSASLEPCDVQAGCLA